MPRPEQTPGPAYKTGNELPRGTAQQVADLEAASLGMQVAEVAASGEPGDQRFEPRDDEDVFAFSPTDRPDEPLTQGAPFGPGASFTPYAFESQQGMLQRIADQMASQPNAPDEVRAFANRLRRGL